MIVNQVIVSNADDAKLGAEGQTNDAHAGEQGAAGQVQVTQCPAVLSQPYQALVSQPRAVRQIQR